MKLSQLALGLVMGSVAASGFAASINGDSGTITITGKVTTSTCKVSNDNNGNINVILPTVGIDALNAEGKTAGKRQFDVKLSGCKGEKVALTLSADSAKGAQLLGNGVLKNQAADKPAGNVGIALFDEQAGGKRIELNGNKQNNTVLTESQKDGQETTLRYSAAYYATGAATAGNVLAIATYEIAYE